MNFCTHKLSFGSEMKSEAAASVTAVNVPLQGGNYLLEYEMP